ncbi:MAG: 3-isopropylmalate dehydratase small subunit [Gammaproteobacteria bacterium]
MSPSAADFSGLAASLDVANVDTDSIIPIQYCINRDRPHFDVGLFRNWRFDEDGQALDFVLNREPWNKARILIAGPNFGCGSSREMAVWALADFGIRCVIAPGFGEIFYNNCFHNGVLAATVSAVDCEQLHQLATSEPYLDLIIDVVAKSIRHRDDTAITFELDEMRSSMLLDGVDPITATLHRIDTIEAFEARDRARRPWAQIPGTGSSTNT